MDFWGEAAADRLGEGAIGGEDNAVTGEVGTDFIATASLLTLRFELDVFITTIGLIALRDRVCTNSPRSCGWVSGTTNSGWGSDCQAGS